MKHALLWCTLPFFAVVACGQESLLQAGRAGSIDRCINVFTPSAAESTKAGYQYWFVDRNALDGRTLKLSVVRPHESTHAPHAHAEDEFFVVLEGDAEFMLNGDARVVGPYTSLYCPSQSVHGIRNCGRGELRYLVLKKYPDVSASPGMQGAPAEASGPFRDTSFTVWSAWRKMRAEYPAATPAVVAPSEGVMEWHNIVYATIGRRCLSLDLFAPSGPSAQVFPGVLIIHGGGWRSGSKEQEFPMARRLAAQGYVAVTAEYRLSPEACYPAGVHDLKAALRWMRAHGEEFGIDTLHIAVMGGSAGGTLAALLGVTGGLPAFEGRGGYAHRSTVVQAVVDIDGIVDFADSAESGKDADPSKPSSGRLWFGGTYADRGDLWREASPLTWARAGVPPIMFVNSSLPRFHAGRDAMIAMLRHAGVYTDVHTIPDTPHPFWLFHPWFDETSRIVAAFLELTLKAEGSTAKKR